MAVGVRNLIKERQKYLFRSLLTKKERSNRFVLFYSFINLHFTDVESGAFYPFAGCEVGH